MLKRSRVSVGYIDPDPQRARLNSAVVDRINDLAGVTVETRTPAAADTEFAVLHPNLGRVASEYEVVMQGKAGRLYASSRTLWTAKASFFKYSAAADQITVRLR